MMCIIGTEMHFLSSPCLYAPPLPFPAVWVWIRWGTQGEDYDHPHWLYSRSDDGCRGGGEVLNNHHVSSTHAKMKKGLGEPVIVVCLGLVARAETNFLPETEAFVCGQGGVGQLADT